MTEVNIELEVIPDDDFPNRNLAFKQEITSFEKTQINIQLTFTNPSSVSYGGYIDILMVSFLDTSLLIRDEDQQTILKGTVLTSELPKM